MFLVQIRWPPVLSNLFLYIPTKAKTIENLRSESIKANARLWQFSEYYESLLMLPFRTAIGSVQYE